MARHFNRKLLPLLLCTMLASTAQAAARKNDPLHAWAGGDDPARLEQWVNERLAAEQASIGKLLAVKGKRSVANTLAAYDEAQNQLALAGNGANLLFTVGRTAEVRNKAQALTEKISSAATDLALNRKVYDALAAVPLPSNDPASRRYLEYTLLEYRLAGVNQDEAKRAEIHALQDKITSLSLAFARSVQDGTQTITATREELDGLPDDFIARHKPGADGKYAFNTDEPDRGPINSFAKSADLRHRMYIAYNTRAYPANKQVLLDLLSTRQKLAGILGFSNFAELATADQMTGSAAAVHKLLDDIDAASREAKDKEYAQLLAFVKTKEPGATAISAADSGYWSEQFRRQQFTFDAQSVRPYFPYEQVEAGILDTAAKIFHVQFRPVKNAEVWHPSVTVFDVMDGGKRVGRIYLDMHPREGKDKWFSASPVVPGIRGKQVPEGRLTCNFSGGIPSDPGLMQYGEVVTFFHEFGHLMHHILGSQNRWSQQGGFNVEGDFVEAPSQMLEEFFRSYDVLSTFAKHYQTGAVIPKDVVARMNAANAFGRGGWAQGQLFYSTLSLNTHDRPAADVDLDAQLHQVWNRFMPYTFVDGNRFYTTFTHLTGYSSNYYTYALDKVIAIDMFARFDKEHPLGGSAAADYRKYVIDPGATKPAAQLVQDFLGRPQNIDAFKTWLGEEFN
ncbi:peptidase M3 [Pseudoduganella eburnea]|uniref:Peptidase M3 n=1 Tax=Massilia eburnea TaxID=1776165 RepID=A0A6L6QLV2_9BURK|nr:M3 family metallopeptidase [Massilia eburnea]MTW12583.1 peptidase M3 [Massilia eburnea]